MSADEAGPDELPDIRDGLLSVPEAARALGISESTAWRWIDRGILPAVRVGPKRVFVRREDLEPLTAERRKPRIAPPPKLTKAQRERGLKALKLLQKFREEQLVAQEGEYFPSSLELLYQTRDERSRHLAEMTGATYVPPRDHPRQ